MSETPRCLVRARPSPASTPAAAGAWPGIVPGRGPQQQRVEGSPRRQRGVLGAEVASRRRGGGAQHGVQGPAGFEEAVDLVEHRQPMLDAHAAGVRAHQHAHAQLTGDAQMLGVRVQDAAQVAHGVGAPAHGLGLCPLKVHRAEGGHPGELAVAHAGKHVAAHEEAVLDGVHARRHGHRQAFSPLQCANTCGRRRARPAPPRRRPRR